MTIIVNKGSSFPPDQGRVFGSKSCEGPYFFL